MLCGGKPRGGGGGSRLKEYAGWCIRVNAYGLRFEEGILQSWMGGLVRGGQPVGLPNPGGGGEGGLACLQTFCFNSIMWKIKQVQATSKEAKMRDRSLPSKHFLHPHQFEVEAKQVLRRISVSDASGFVHSGSVQGCKEVRNAESVGVKQMFLCEG